MGNRLARVEPTMRSFVLVAFLACAGAFSLSAAPQSTRVVVSASSAEAVMLFGKKAAPKKAAPKKVAKKAAPKKAAPKKVVAKKAPAKKAAPKPKVVRQRNTEPNIVQKLFAMPLIGGGKGVDLGPEYDL